MAARQLNREAESAYASKGMGSWTRAQKSWLKAQTDLAQTAKTRCVGRLVIQSIRKMHNAFQAIQIF
jgi:hypothetical protein